MATQTWTWTTEKGTELTLTYEETQFGLRDGRLTSKTGIDYHVSLPVMEQGQTCVSLGKNTYCPIPKEFSAEILRANEDVRAQSTVALEAYLHDVAPLAAKYEATKDNAESVADEITARDAYHKALAAWRAQYPGAELPGTIRWNPEINDDNIWSF